MRIQTLQKTYLAREKEEDTQTHTQTQIDRSLVFNAQSTVKDSQRGRQKNRETRDGFV